MSLNIFEYPSYSKSLEYLEIAYKHKVLPNCKLETSWVFFNIQAANTGKFLPENPTDHADSRTFKNIQGIHKTLEVLEPAWFVGFSGKSLLKERMVQIILGKC